MNESVVCLSLTWSSQQRKKEFIPFVKVHNSIKIRKQTVVNNIGPF